MNQCARSSAEGESRRASVYETESRWFESSRALQDKRQHVDGYAGIRPIRGNMLTVMREFDR